eukprot:jgi/Tetstr1/465484/TSEL_010168.t1
MVPDAKLSLPAFNVVTGSYDPRSLKSKSLEFKTMRALPLRDIMDMSEYTGMVFGTLGEVSKGYAAPCAVSQAWPRIGLASPLQRHVYKWITLGPGASRSSPKRRSHIRWRGAHREDPDAAPILRVTAAGGGSPGRQPVSGASVEWEVTPPIAAPQSRWASGGALRPYPSGTHSLTGGSPLPAEKEVVFVRHGLSTWNQEGRIQGDTDESTLTPGGEEQARMVKDALIDIPFDSCFSSPIMRARRTAEIVWEGRDGELVYLDNLREANLSILQGMRNVDAEVEHPELFNTWREMPHEFCNGGHYPVVDVWERAAEAWCEILEAPGTLHLVVTHKSILRAMMCTALGLPPSSFRSLDIHNSGVSRFRVNKQGEAMLVNLNLTTHLHMPGVHY